MSDNKGYFRKALKTKDNDVGIERANKLYPATKIFIIINPSKNIFSQDEQLSILKV